MSNRYETIGRVTVQTCDVCRLREGLYRHSSESRESRILALLERRNSYLVPAAIPALRRNDVIPAGMTVIKVGTTLKTESS